MAASNVFLLRESAIWIDLLLSEIVVKRSFELVTVVGVKSVGAACSAHVIGESLLANLLSLRTERLHVDFARKDVLHDENELVGVLAFFTCRRLGGVVDEVGSPAVVDFHR